MTKIPREKKHRTTKLSIVAVTRVFITALQVLAVLWRNPDVFKNYKYSSTSLFSFHLFSISSVPCLLHLGEFLALLQASSDCFPASGTTHLLVSAIKERKSWVSRVLLHVKLFFHIQKIDHLSTFPE